MDRDFFRKEYEAVARDAGGSRAGNEGFNGGDVTNEDRMDNAPRVRPDVI